jgi:SAM-dependent methyltransferase
MSNTQHEQFFREYTSQDAISKYTKATAGGGISYLLDHEYKDVYLKALHSLPSEILQSGIRILEFGCGGGMNLIHLLSVLRKEGVQFETAVGTDFSPVLIEAAKSEAKNYLTPETLRRIEFHVAKNESLVADLASGRGTTEAELKGSFHLVLGVNTIRYCHAAGKEMDCVQNIFDLLIPGGVCVAIDMNNRFPLFRSDWKNRLRRQKEEQCYVPSLEEYTAPFVRVGFEILRSEHFCWVPHSASGALQRLTVALSPVLNAVAQSRAMRSLVVASRPR